VKNSLPFLLQEKLHVTFTHATYCFDIDVNQVIGSRKEEQVMRRREFFSVAKRSVLVAAYLAAGLTNVQAEEPAPSMARVCCVEDGEPIPTGMKITPTAAPGAVFQSLNPDLPPPLDQFVVGHAVATAVSPDGKTLLILTSGYNRNELSSGGSNEYVFVYDISANTPVKRQVLQLPRTFNGIDWNPNGNEFYVSGGGNDNVHVFERQNSVWTETTAPISLGHTDAPGWGVGPVAAGLAVNARGDRLVVANIYNDSVSIVDVQSRTKVHEVELRPGKINSGQSGVSGGQYLFWVVIQGNEKAYVSSQRDREIVIIDLTAATPAVVGRASA
jgi:WD40 repeat protein